MSKLQKRNHSILKDWNNKNYFFKKYSDVELTQTSTVSPKLYGLPKLHKPNFPIKPGHSNVNSPFSFLSKTLTNHLKNCIPQPASHIKNSFELIDKLKNLHILDDHVLFSLNVASLFTDVTKELVINSFDRRYAHIRDKCKMEFHDVIDGVKFLFDNTVLTFNDIIYLQKVRTPMGSRVCLFADIAMEDLKNKCLSRLDLKPIFHYRYVDDIIACISKAKLQYMLNIFNSYHEKLK